MSSTRCHTIGRFIATFTASYEDLLIFCLLDICNGNVMVDYDTTMNCLICKYSNWSLAEQNPCSANITYYSTHCQQSLGIFYSHSEANSQYRIIDLSSKVAHNETVSYCYTVLVQDGPVKVYYEGTFQAKAEKISPPLNLFLYLFYFRLLKLSKCAIIILYNKNFYA